MAGSLQNNPWSYIPYTQLAAFGSGSPMPGAFTSPQTPYGQAPPFGAPQVHLAQLVQQVQQLAQIIPQQILQLQQAIQFLPQHVAQLVAQTLIQSQANIPSFGQPGIGSPFQTLPTSGSPFIAGQPGAVM